MKILKSPVLLWFVLAAVLCTSVLRSEDYDEEPIRYSATAADDPVARLVQRLDSGAVKLRWDENHGWLPSLLEALDIPTSSQTLVFSKTSLQRERIMPTYIGSGLAIPHGRLDGIGRPMLAFARFDEGVPLDTTNEHAELFFLLRTPSGMARIQPRLLATIAGLFKNEYVTERLHKAQTPEAIIEAIRGGQQVALD